MTTFYPEFGDALIDTLSYIELSRFKLGEEFSYDVTEYISLINAIARLSGYTYGPIRAKVKLVSERDLIYRGLTSQDKITRIGDKEQIYQVLISNPTRFLLLSLSQLKEKI